MSTNTVTVADILCLLVVVVAVIAVIYGPSFCTKIRDMFSKVPPPPEPLVATINGNLKKGFQFRGYYPVVFEFFKIVQRWMYYLQKTFEEYWVIFCQG